MMLHLINECVNELHREVGLKSDEYMSLSYAINEMDDAEENVNGCVCIIEIDGLKLVS